MEYRETCDIETRDLRKTHARDRFMETYPLHRFKKETYPEDRFNGITNGIPRNL